MAGQFKTSDDLIKETLANLGVLVAGMPPDPEDYLYVQEKLDPTLRKIAGLEIAYVPDPENIPGAYFSDLADILAGECCTKFGVTNDDYQKLINKGLGGVNGVDVGFGAAAKSLRAIARSKPTRETLQSHYF